VIPDSVDSAVVPQRVLAGGASVSQPQLKVEAAG
jgi:hypothetical protein